MGVEVRSRACTISQVSGLAIVSTRCSGLALTFRGCDSTCWADWTSDPRLDPGHWRRRRRNVLLCRCRSSADEVMTAVALNFDLSPLVVATCMSDVSVSPSGGALRPEIRLGRRVLARTWCACGVRPALLALLCLRRKLMELAFGVIFVKLDLALVSNMQV